MFPTFEAAGGRVGRIAGSDPARATYYTAALIGIHKYCSGQYEEDAAHTYLPSLLRGRISERVLREWGVETEFSTRDLGVLPAWGVDCASAGGDLAIIVGGGKLTQVSLAGLGKVKFVRVLPFTRASQGVGIGMRGLGRVAGVAYAPYAGYSYFADGSFIDDPSGDSLRVVGTVGEGFIAGWMVAGPWGGVVGAGLSTAGAFKGAMDALDNVVEDGKRQARYVGVKMTLRRGAEGWLLPDSAPDNVLSRDAKEFIEQTARSQFIEEVIEIKERHGIGDDVPFSPDDWGRNWAKIDDFLKEVDDFRNGRFTYVGVDVGPIKWHAKQWHPLSGVSGSAKAEILRKYIEIFENSNGTKQELTKLYQRSWLVTSWPGMRGRGDSEWRPETLSGWDRFMGRDKQYGLKTVIEDSVTDLAKRYQTEGFAQEEQLLRERIVSGEIDHSHPDVQRLAASQQEFLLRNFPNFYEVLATAEGMSQMTSFTTLDDSNVLDAAGRRSRSSEIMNSFAAEMAAGPSVFRMEQLAEEYAASGFPSREAGIRARIESGELSFQSDEVGELIDEQREFLLRRVPNFFELIHAEEGSRRMEHFTVTSDPSAGPAERSDIMCSLLVEVHRGVQRELKEVMDQTRDPEFQALVLGALDGEDREDLRRHFANEQLLEAEGFADLMEKATNALLDRLGSEEASEGVLPPQSAPSDLTEEERELMGTQLLREEIFPLIGDEERQVLDRFWQSGAREGREEALDIIEKALEAVEAAEQQLPGDFTGLTLPRHRLSSGHGEAVT